MGVIYFNGLETGDRLQLATPGSTAVVSSFVRTGTYSLQTGTAEDSEWLNGQSLSAFYARIPIYLGHAGTPGVQQSGYVMLARDTSDVLVASIVLIHTTSNIRQIVLQNGVTSTNVGSLITVPIGAWLVLEVAITISATVGRLELMVNGVMQASSVTENTGTTNIKSIRPGYFPPAYTTVFFDDVAFRDDAYPGPGRSIARQGLAGAPNANTWTKTSSQTAAQVWSETPYSATNEAHSTEPSQAQTMLVADVGAGTDAVPAGARINACSVGVVAKEIGAGSTTPTYSIRRRISAADTDTAKALTTSDAFYSDGIWTAARSALQAAEIGGVRGSGVDTVQIVTAGTEGSGGSGNVTPGLPGSLAANDILICVVHSTDQVAHSMNGTYWSQIQQGNGGGSTSRLSTWWHRYDGSTDPDRIVTHTAGDTIVAGIVAYRGCIRTGSPINTSSAVAGGTDGTMEGSTITPTVDGCMLLHAHGAGDDNSVTQLSGWTARFEDSGGGTQNAYVSATGTDGLVGVQDQLQAAKAATGTITITQAASDAWACCLIALTPASKHMQIEDAWLFVDYADPPVADQLFVRQALVRASYW